ncbi:hypothetical protein [Streptomyces sp. NPDC021096]|uniref:hypothetical protein n=1 Tax=Streptomyces sp. NPDC021096 TaxID=3154792 RepID=UPI0033C8AE38
MSTQAMTARRSAAGKSADLLRITLRIDGWACAGLGVVLLAGCKLLSDPLGLPTTWSVALGIVILGIAAGIAFIVRHERTPSGPAAAVIAVNSLSFVGFLALAFTDVVPLTGLGTAFMVLTAVVVGLFADVEFVALRRARAAAAVRV